MDCEIHTHISCYISGLWKYTYTHTGCYITTIYRPLCLRVWDEVNRCIYTWMWPLLTSFFYLAFSVNIYLSLSSGNFFNVWTSRCNFHQGNWCIEARLCSLWSTSLSIKWNNETSQLPSFQHCFLSENFSLLTICGINIANELLEYFFSPFLLSPCWQYTKLFSKVSGLLPSHPCSGAKIRSVLISDKLWNST